MHNCFLFVCVPLTRLDTFRALYVFFLIPLSICIPMTKFYYILGSEMLYTIFDLGLKVHT